MARNKVQFQKSMSIHTFIQRYGDEAQCQQRLFDIRCHKDSSAQTADIPMLANSNRDPSTNVINATNKPR